MYLFIYIWVLLKILYIDILHYLFIYTTYVKAFIYYLFPIILATSIKDVLFIHFKYFFKAYWYVYTCIIYYAYVKVCWLFIYLLF